MTIEELNKLIDIEIQWLKYYSLASSRESLNEQSDIYSDLKEMAYSKRRMPLAKRCCPYVITSEQKIDKNTDISEVNISLSKNRGNNVFSPIEAFIKLYPNRKMEIINRLKSSDYNGDEKYNVVHYFK